MSIKNAPYYWVECDDCGERAEYGEYSALADQGDAETMALEDADFTTDGVEHHCHRCPPLFKCEDCGKPVTDQALENGDGLCESCHAKETAGVA